MKYRLFACDIDGTLFGEDMAIHEDNVRSIQKAVCKGVVFAICSGRPDGSASKVARRVGLDAKGQYIICFNGAAIVEAGGGEKIYGLPLAGEYGRHVIKTAVENDISVIAYIGGKPVSYREDGEIAAYRSRVGLDFVIDQKLHENDRGDFDKVLLRADASALKKAEEQLAPWIEGKVACVYSDPRMLEFFNFNACKGNALLFLAERLGIKQEETIAIGDYFNDISMLEAAGLGCTVNGSPEEVRLASGYVTERSASQGAVSEVIERFVLRG